MSRRVVVSPEAQRDLVQLYNYIAEESGTRRAQAYVDRITSYLVGFADFPERGTRRDDLWPGLRLTGFERRVTIAFHLKAEAVIIDRILYGGRDLKIEPPGDVI